jgi:hypothetical protein
MADETSKKADMFLQSDNQDLRALFAKVKQLGDLNQKIIPYLDPSMTDYCQVANLVNGTLILVAANGSIATQIRFQANDLLRKFKQDPTLGNIRAIQCKVRPLPSTTRQQPTTPTKMAHLSPETASIMRDIADSIDDPKLREAMRRIAGHIKK